MTTKLQQHSDECGYALEALAKSQIKNIHMIGRRGPAQAAFTPVEIREFGKLEDCAPVINPDDLNLDKSSGKATLCEE